MIRPSNIQYHAGAAGMMGKPSSPIESDSIIVSIVLDGNFIAALINDCGMCPLSARVLGDGEVIPQNDEGTTLGQHFQHISCGVQLHRVEILKTIRNRFVWVVGPVDDVEQDIGAHLDEDLT